MKKSITTCFWRLFTALLFISCGQAVSAQNWSALNGVTAQDISIGKNGKIWMTSKDQYIYRWDGSTFEKIEGQAQQVAVDPNGNAWVVQSNGAIWRFNPNVAYPGSWTQMPGSAKSLSIGANGSIWRIGTDAAGGGYGIYRWNGSNWDNIPGGAVQIAVDAAGNAWVVQSNGATWTYNPANNGPADTWINMQVLSKNISIGADGTVWRIGTDQGPEGFGIYKWGGASNWTKVAGSAVRVAAEAGGNLWAINSSNIVYRPGAAVAGGGNPVNNASRLDAEYIQLAIVANAGNTDSIGHYEEQTVGLWKSYVNNTERTYKETGRDAGNIYLSAADNGENVVINALLMQVSVNGVGKYTIKRVSDEVIPEDSEPTTGGDVNPATNPPPVANNNNRDITNYISGLSYDPRILLSVTEGGSSEAKALPPSGATNRSLKENGVIICTKIPRKLDEKMEKISVFKPTAGVVFPGALILADRRLAEGLPTPITLNRSPITLSLDLPGLTINGSRTISSPRNSNVQEAINQMLEEWNRNPASNGYSNTSRNTSKFERAYSSEQLALSLGFRLDWADNFVKGGVKVNTNSESDVTVAFFQQVYYSIVMDPPTRPADVFDPSVTIGDVRSVVNDKSPAAYVRSIDYGRTIMVRMESTLKSAEIDFDIAIKYATGTVTIEGETKNKITNFLKTARFTVYTVGGNAQNAAPLTFMGSTDLSKLQEVINSGATYNRSNPGVPISYTVAFLKDNTTASVNSLSDYVETKCTEFPNAFVKLVHNGAYVARFTVTWQEPNEQGVLVSKSFSSGEKTAGYTYTLNLPGDAANVIIKGEAATGLVWDPWGEAINVTEKSPTRCTYTISGTTLNRTYEKTNCPNQ